MPASAAPGDLSTGAGIDIAAVFEHNVFGSFRAGSHMAAIIGGALEFVFLYTAYRAWRTHDRKRRLEVEAWTSAAARVEQLYPSPPAGSPFIAAPGSHQ